MTPFGEHPADAEVHADLLAAADELIRRTNADLCEWNGTIEVHGMQNPRGRPAALGKAPWNGTMSLREDVLAMLREMWQRPPPAWSAEDRARQEPAVLTVVHELAHYLVPAGQRYSTGKAAFDEFPGRALEEGVTELAGRMHVGAFHGAEARSPGVTNARNASSYPQFVPAAQTIVRYVSELRGESQGEVLNALVRQTVPGKFRKLSQMVLESKGTGEQISPADRDAASRPIIDAVWGAFNANRDWASPEPQDRPTQAPKARSRIMGLQVVAAMERGRLQALDAYGQERPETPWQLAAAQYEHRLALAAIELTRSSAEPDVRAAADAWRQQAERRLRDAWMELDPKRAPRGNEPPGHRSVPRGIEAHRAGQEPGPRDPSASRERQMDRARAGPEPPHPSVPHPEPASVPSLAEPARTASPRPLRRLGVHRRPGRPDRGRER